jgi:hypothetical protein
MEWRCADSLKEQNPGRLPLGLAREELSCIPRICRFGSQPPFFMTTTLLLKSSNGCSSSYWDVPMGKSWRELTKPVSFSEMDSRMENKVGDQGIIRWTVFDLTTFCQAAANLVFDLAASRTWPKK